MLEDPCWLTGGGADSGLNYCRSCADKELNKYSDECFVDGGWPIEEDDPPECEICCIPLAASLLGDSHKHSEVHTLDEWISEMREQ